MTRSLLNGSKWMFASGLAVGLLVGFGMMVGVLSTRWFDNRSLALPVSEMKLHAMATDAGQDFSMCTGPIADGMEGVFFLDYLTGDLNCMVPNARTGLVGGAYKHNIMADLNIEAGATKKPQFLMVTGMSAFRATSGDPRPAECILYVADAASGNWVAYSLPWSRALAATGAPQRGNLIKIGGGKARELVIRE
jgi:hypothetical protein